MSLKRFFVDLTLAGLLVLLAWYCYSNGKAYDLIMQNDAVVVEGASFAGMEAVQLSIDGGASKTLYDGDIDQMTAVGTGAHKLRIDVLDLEDRPIAGQSKVFQFRLRDLGDKGILNIPYAYANGVSVK